MSGAKGPAPQQQRRDTERKRDQRRAGHECGQRRHAKERGTAPEPDPRGRGRGGNVRGGTVQFGCRAFGLVERAESGLDRWVGSQVAAGDGGKVGETLGDGIAAGAVQDGERGAVVPRREGRGHQGLLDLGHGQRGWRGWMTRGELSGPLGARDGHAGAGLGVRCLGLREGAAGLDRTSGSGLCRDGAREVSVMPSLRVPQRRGGFRDGLAGLPQRAYRHSGVGPHRGLPEVGQTADGFGGCGVPPRAGGRPLEVVLQAVCRVEDGQDSRLVDRYGGRKRLSVEPEPPRGIRTAVGDDLGRHVAPQPHVHCPTVDPTAARSWLSSMTRPSSRCSRAPTSHGPSTSSHGRYRSVCAVLDRPTALATPSSGEGQSGGRMPGGLAGLVGTHDRPSTRARDQGRRRAAARMRAR